MSFDQWQSANDDLLQQLPFHIAEWVAEFGSLTEKLARYVDSVELDLLQENIAQACSSENLLLGITNGELSRVREVVLYGPKKPWIFARTIMPLDTAHLIKSLGNKPLGSILFSGKDLHRAFLQIRKLDQSDRLYKSALNYLVSNDKDYNINQHNTLWARRSLWVNKQNDQSLAMLVCEVFLPDSPVYNN